jgi:hypothetical protein
MAANPPTTPTVIPTPVATVLPLTPLNPPLEPPPVWLMLVEVGNDVDVSADGVLPKSVVTVVPTTCVD